MTDQELLQAAGDALYGIAGPWWHTRLAEDLGVHVRSVRRWASGERAPSAGAWRDLAILIAKRCDSLTQAGTEAAKRAAQKALSR